MDSVTQIVLGAAVGEAVLGKKIGNKAMLLGAIAGTIPDLDVIANYFTDTVSALEMHRGFTHSIVFAVVFGLLFGWLLSLWDKRASFKEWSWFWFLCFVTHPLLDAHTTWGTQLFWPLDLRLAYKNIFVIDPLYTLPFLVFLILAMFQKRGSIKRRKFNNLGLIISSAYMLLTLILKGITYYKFENALKNQNIAYSEIQTKPSPMNTILWTANVETEDAFLIGDYSFFDSKPIQFYANPKNHEALGDLRENEKVNRLIKITQGWYTISEKPEGIYLNDLRFGKISVDPNSDKYAFSFLIEKVGDDVKITEEPKEVREGGKLLLDLWKRIKGN
ncbi:putative membrane-bound metal-dependent hydrolase [Aequorivita sublithincola DSM 14238]|uniref:Putative membrane-bound metal-dependent hydrolase n=1 Tax=Aequorivita sublithincola (strain DSM 14238 / LMG 21431 / ACAM 643 / 9-3) TaxID=746697 RepID=I3YVU1_AEQSU|nr:metal-dependent hydrolase [Aequorivita sublithincola]AFL81109.1 putative membrane-bound metal-dependent hydrolase [Aequorivita sublithincola DSM 14238]